MLQMMWFPRLTTAAATDCETLPRRDGFVVSRARCVVILQMNSLANVLLDVRKQYTQE